MNGISHKAAAIAPGLALISVGASTGDLVPGVVGFLACVAGSKAPDWLEIPLVSGQRVIPHRRITHWALGWLVVATLAVAPGMLPTALLQMAVFGFSLGALTHVFGDLLTPAGVPVLHPWKRTSLAGVNQVPGGEVAWVLSVWLISFLGVAVVNWGADFG